MNAFSILVSGARGDYTVSRTADGRWHCDCAAMRFGRGAACKHILSMHRPEAPAAAPALRGAA